MRSQTDREIAMFSMRANARLDLRLSEKDRERIDRAAALAGLPLAAFAWACAETR